MLDLKYMAEKYSLYPWLVNTPLSTTNQCLKKSGVDYEQNSSRQSWIKTEITRIYLRF